MSKKNKYEDPYELDVVDDIINNVFRSKVVIIGEFDEDGNPIDEHENKWWDPESYREDGGAVHVPSYGDYLNAGKKKKKKDKKRKHADDDYLLSPTNGAPKNARNMEDAVVKAHLAAQKEQQRADDIVDNDCRFTKVEDLFAEMESQGTASDDAAPEMVRGQSYYPCGDYQQSSDEDDMRYNPDEVSRMIGLSLAYEERFGRIIVNDGLCSFSELSAGINPNSMLYFCNPEKVLWMLGHEENNEFKYEPEKSALTRNGLYKLFIADRHPAAIFTKDEMITAFGNIASIDNSKFVFFRFNDTETDEELYFAYHINAKGLEIFNTFVTETSSNFLSYIADELDEYKLQPSVIVEIAELITMVSIIRSHRRAADSFLPNDHSYLTLFRNASETIDNDGEHVTTIPLFNMKEVFIDFVQNEEQTKIKPKTDDIEEIENILHVEDYHDIDLLGINIIGIIEDDDDEDDDEDFVDDDAADAIENIASNISRTLSGDAVDTDNSGETGQESTFIPEEDNYRSSAMINPRSNVAEMLQEHMDVFGSACEDDDAENLLDQISKYVDDKDTIDYEKVHENLSAIGQTIDVLDEVSDEELTSEKLEEILQGSITVTAKTGSVDVIEEPKAEAVVSEGIKVDVEVKPEEKSDSVMTPDKAENVGASTMADALAKAGMVIPVVRKRPVSD